MDEFLLELDCDCEQSNCLVCAPRDMGQEAQILYCQVARSDARIIARLKSGAVVMASFRPPLLERFYPGDRNRTVIATSVCQAVDDTQPRVVHLQLRQMRLGGWMYVISWADLNDWLDAAVEAFYANGGDRDCIARPRRRRDVIIQNTPNKQPVRIS